MRRTRRCRVAAFPFLALSIAVLVSVCAAGQTPAPAYTPIVTDQSALSLSNKMAVVGISTVNQNGDYMFSPAGSTAVFLRKSGASTPTRLLQHGDTMPGVSGSRFDIFSTTSSIVFRMNDSAQIVMGVSYLDATGHLTLNTALYDGSSLQLLVQPSDVAPGSGGSLFGANVSPVGIDTAGDVAFTAFLAPSSDPFSSLNLETLFIKPIGGSAVRVVGVGDSATGTGGGTFASIAPVSMNTAGVVLFRASINGGVGGNAWYIGTTSGIQRIASVGANTNSSTALTFVNTVAVLNNTGKVVFMGSDANGVALWSWTSSSGITRLMGQGDAAPVDVGGTLSSPATTFVLSDSGELASLWTVSGGATSGNVLLRFTGPGQLETVAYVGEAAPGTTTTFTTLQGIAINSSGLIAFKGQVGTGIYTQTRGSTPSALIHDGGALNFGGTYLASGVTPVVLDDGRIFFNANVEGNSSFDNADVMYNSGTFSALMTDGDTLPSGASVSLRTFAATSAGNYVGYLAQLSGGQVSYWTHNTSTGTDVRVAASGDAAPGVSGGILRLFAQNQLNINASGQVVFLTTVVASPNNYVAIYVWDPSTGLHLIVKSGDLEPTTGIAFNNLVLSPLGPAPINSSGQVLFEGALANGRVGLFVYSTAGELGKVYLSGDGAPGGGTFTSSVFLSTAQLNDSGQVAFQASTTNVTEAVFIGTPGGATQMVGPAPNSSTTTLTRDLSFNNNGYAAFVWESSLIVASTTSAQTIAGTGSAAPASAGGTFNFTFVSDAYIAPNNDVVFRAGLSGGNGSSGYFYWHSGTGLIDTILIQGQPVPGLTGWSFQDVLGSSNAQSNFGSNTAGDIFLTTNIASGVSGVEALFRYRPTSQTLELVARRGGSDPNSGGTLTQAIMRNLAGSRAQVEPAFWGTTTGGSFGDAIFTVNPVSVTLAATATSATVAMGQTADVTFSVTNNGPSAAANAVFTANVPTGLAVSSLPGPNCNSTATTITCTLGTVQVGETQSGVFGFTPDLTVVPANAPSTVVTIGGSISADSSNVATASSELTVQRQSDLQLVSVTDNSPVSTAGPLTFSAQISNAGPNDATGAVVSFTLPTSGYTLQSFSALGTCTQASGSNIVSCNLGTLTASSNVTGALTVTPDPAAVTGVSSIVATSVQISSSAVVDAAPSNNVLSINSTIAHTADLSMTGAGPASSVTAGSAVTFTATVTNNGPEAANATVTATLPAGFTFVSASWSNAYGAPSGGACTFANNLISCPVGSLPYSPASATITVNATAGSQLGFFSVAATASSSTSLDPAPRNDAAGATALVALTGNAHDALLLPLSTRGTMAILDTSLNQLAPEPPVFTAQPRYGPAVLPNGRIAFVPRSGGASYISVFDLSIGAEINRVYDAPVSYPLALSPDGQTLVAVNNSDTVSLIDTTTFAVTSVPLNGVVGDNPGSPFDIVLHAPAIVGRKAYFNPSGLLLGSSTNGIPVVVVDLDTHAVSTIAMPTSSRGVIPPSGSNLSPYTIVATPDRHYLVIARQDGTVIYDLTTGTVAARETTTTAARLLATYRDLGDPNAYAYQITSGTAVLSAIDLRTGSPTFGKIVATATTAAPDSYFRSTAIQSASIALSADGAKLFTSDSGSLITTVDVRSLLNNAGGAAFNTSTYPNQFDFNGLFAAAVDLTPVAGAPTITSISPPTATAGATTVVTISGTNFAPDAIVFGNGGQAEASEVVSVSPTQIQLQLKLNTNEPAGTFDVGVTNPNSGSPNQQNLSAEVHNGFTILPAAGATITDAIAAVLNSNAVVRVAPSGPATEPPSPPFRSIRPSLAVTTDGAYAFAPIGAEGVDVIDLSTGSHTIKSIPNTGSGGSRLIRSIDPVNGAPVVYFTDGTTLFKVDADPASRAFGASLASIASGVPFTMSNAFSIAASPGGRYVYVAEASTGLTPDAQILIYDTQAGTRPSNLALNSVGAVTNQNSMLVTPDGKYLVLQLSTAGQVGLLSLANPTSPVLANVLTGSVPSGYVSVNLV